LTFWLPIAVMVAISFVIGHSIHGYRDIPILLSPVEFASGITLAFGGLVGLYQPQRFEHWFDTTAEPTWRATSQYLFAVILGTISVYWGVMAAVSPLL
jgi:hypothetical protein